jgi:PAS domain S-box-containing protein
MNLRAQTPTLSATEQQRPVPAHPARWQRRAMLAAIFYAALFEAWLVWRPGGPAWLVPFDDVATEVAMLSLAPLALAMARRQPAWRGRAGWSCLAAGTLLFAGGNAIGNWYVLALGQANASPLLATICYTFAYLAILGSVAWVPLTGGQGERSWLERCRLLADALIAAGAIFVFVWYFALGPAIFAAAGSWSDRITAIAFPIADLALGACFITLMVRLRIITPPYILLLGALLTLSAADISYAYLSLHGWYHTGMPLDGTWVAGYMLADIGILMIGNAPRRAQASADPPATRLGLLAEMGVQLLPYLLFVAAGILIAASWVIRGDKRLEPVMLATLLLLLALLVARQTVALAERASLAHIARVAAQRAQQAAERTEAHAQQRLAELAFIARVLEAIDNARDREETLRYICDGLAAALQISVCAIALRTPEDGRWVGVAASQRAHAQWRGISIGPEAPPAFWEAMEQGKLLIVEDSHQAEPLCSLCAALAPRALLTIPLRIDGRAGGAICLVDQERPRHFSDEALALAKALAGHAAVAIEHARLFEEVRRHRDEAVALANSLLESMAEGVAMIDRHGRIVYWNLRLAQWFGLAAEAVLGQEGRVVLSQVLGSIHAPEVLRANIAAALARLDERPLFTVTLAGPPARELRVRMFPVRDAHGATCGIGSVVTDITTEREAERLRSQFVAMASHELRTPLAAISGFLELLQARDATLTPEKRLRYLVEARRQTDRLTAIMNAFLDLSRLEAGHETLHLMPLAPQIMIDDAIARISPNEAHRISATIAPGTPAVYADATRIGQVLDNLLDNARKYSPDGGPIQIDARYDDNNPRQVAFTVRDRGLGIPADQQQNLFIPFTRAEAHSQRGIGGTGLGLAIARQIIEQHGGRIWLESSPDEGTAVHFTLPVAESP